MLGFSLKHKNACNIPRKLDDVSIWFSISSWLCLLCAKVRVVARENIYRPCLNLKCPQLSFFVGSRQQANANRWRVLLNTLRQRSDTWVSGQLSESSFKLSHSLHKTLFYFYEYIGKIHIFYFLIKNMSLSSISWWCVYNLTFTHKESLAMWPDRL